MTVRAEVPAIEDEWKFELAHVLSQFARELTASVTREKTSDEHKAHLAAIARIESRWHAGELTTSQKREAIASENKFYYGREKRSAAVGSSLTSVKDGASAPSHVPASHAAPGPDPWGEDDDEGLRWDQK